MFEKFFTTKILENKEVILYGEKQQKHKLIFDEKTNIEYFELDKFIDSCSINNLKSCDYIIINHNQKQILFCELKNSRSIDNAVLQLNHSKHIIDCFMKILNNSYRYKYSFLVFQGKKKFNKKTTTIKQKITNKIKHYKINNKEINFKQFKYEEN